MLRSSIVLSCLLWCSVAHAQPSYVGAVTHHLTFREVNAETLEPVAHPNGIIEPGEAVQISLSMSFTPPVGSSVPPPWPSTFTVAALGGGMVEVHASSGTWHNWSLREGWNNPIGSYNPAGYATAFYIGGIIAQQRAIGAETSNPVENIWQGFWQPSTYTDRMETFSTYHWGASSSTALWLRDPPEPQQFYNAQARTYFAMKQIPIAIPAPGTGAMLLICMGLGGVRRRAAHSLCDTAH